MSEEEKIIIEKAKPVWWERAKRYMFLSQLFHNFILAGGILWGMYVMIEHRVAEVLATPKRTTVLEQRDSAQFVKTDSSLVRHNGYFSVIFNHVDTGVKYKYTRR